MNQGETKNLGQISAIWIGSSAPADQKLIWYDTSERIHKVYESSTGEWMALNPQVITNSTISQLKTIAQSSGLSVGKYFFLTDVGTLAIAITTTKIWYVDSYNNYIVNDLAATITAYINSDNLLIDGSTGVWDNSRGKLIFNFETISDINNVQINEDYVVIRRKSNSSWSWIKIKLSNFISKVSGNSLTWNKGLYFNFSAVIDSIKDQIGGIVGYDEYKADIEKIDNDINNVAETCQNIYELSKTYTDNKTSSESWLESQIGRKISIYQNPPEIPSTASTMSNILNIIFSWIDALRYAVNIKVGNNFPPKGRTGNINSSDTVRSALEKLVHQYIILKNSDNVNLPNNFDKNNYQKDLPSASDTITSAIGKIAKYISNLSSDFESFYRGKFYSYQNGSWISFIDDDEYAQGIPTPYFRIKDGLLTIRLMAFHFSNNNLRPADALVVPLGFFPHDIASKFINSDYFIVNSFALYNNNTSQSQYIKYGYSIIQVIKSYTIKQRDGNFVNIQIAILFEYAKKTQDSSVIELTGRVLLGMYALNTSSGLITRLTDNDNNTDFIILDEVYSLNANALFNV